MAVFSQYAREPQVLPKKGYIVDGSLVFDAPLAHPHLSLNPFTTKDQIGHVCTPNGTTWHLNGRGFNGVGDYITAGNPVSLQLANLTILIWFNTVQNVAAFRSIISKTNAYALSLFSGRLRSFNWVAGTWGQGVAVVNDGVWHLGGVAINAGTGQLYVDGVADGVAFAHAVANQINPLLLGATDMVGSEAFNGTERYVWIYTRALSTAEIQRIYQGTKWWYGR